VAARNASDLVNQELTPESLLAMIQKTFQENVESGFGFPGYPGELYVSSVDRLVRYAVQTEEQLTAAMSKRKNLLFRKTMRGGVSWLEMEISITNNLPEVVATVVAVFNRAREKPENPVEAIGDVLRNMALLLSQGRGLSQQQEVGLVGEVIALSSLAQRFGATQALQGWRGVEGADQDFLIDEAGFEVKTTTSHQRHHWMSSKMQLEAAPAQNLYLYSVMLQSGSEAGLTLPQFLAKGAEQLGVDEQVLMAKAGEAGYDAEDAAFYVNKWHLRSMPLLFDVDEDFPSITPASLSQTLTEPERLLDFQYQVSLEDLAPSKFQLPPPTLGVLQHA